MLILLAGSNLPPGLITYRLVDEPPLETVWNTTISQDILPPETLELVSLEGDTLDALNLAVDDGPGEAETRMDPSQGPFVPPQIPDPTPDPIPFCGIPARPEDSEVLTLAFQWLAAHQRADGGWNFEGTTSGGPESNTAATGLALLAYLSPGQTHKQGSYRQTFRRGLQYLGSAGKVRGTGNRLALDLRGPAGDLEHHALATTALCEAYALTQDKSLKEPAQAAIQFTIDSQDSQSGGWGTSPGAAGELQGLHWHVLSLKSAHQAYPRTRPGFHPCVQQALAFLKAHERDGGRGYASGPAHRDYTRYHCAIGLFCRLQAGGSLATAQGVRGLARDGVSNSGAEYNFLVMQSLCLARGSGLADAYENWRPALMKQIESTQVREGTAHEHHGSWKPRLNSRFGRVGETALNCWTLDTWVCYPNRLDAPDDF